MTAVENRVALVAVGVGAIALVAYLAMNTPKKTKEELQVEQSKRKRELDEKIEKMERFVQETRSHTKVDNERMLHETIPKLVDYIKENMPNPPPPGAGPMHGAGPMDEDTNDEELDRLRALTEELGSRMKQMHEHVRMSEINQRDLRNQRDMQANKVQLSQARNAQLNANNNFLRSEIAKQPRVVRNVMHHETHNVQHVHNNTRNLQVNNQFNAAAGGPPNA